MKKLLLVACVLSCTLLAKAKDWTQYVNPLMGSQSTFELSTGNTYPAIARPWGMNFWTPQTGKMGDGWQYTYTANKIRGFKQTHQPSPWINDYGQFSIMPIVDKPVFDEEKRASWFAHKGEVATPYYYKVYLAEHDIVTEMAPTERAVLFRFTFPENDHSYVVVDAFDKGSYIKIIPEENKIIGYTTRNSGGVPENFKNYFIIEFDKPFTYKATVENGNLQENAAEQTTNHAGAIIGFKTRKGEQVHARIASSFISFEQAAANMNELGKDNLEQLAQKGKDAWNQVLGKIEVEGGNLDQYRTFYSCLYRSLLFPRKFYELDANGQPVHYSPYNGQVLPGYMFTDTGFWDTFRCLFPLLNLMYPSVNKEMQEGLINTYKESGFFPEWASPGHRGCMVGNNSASILVDAYMKGVKVDDIKTLYEGLIHGTENVHPEVSSTGRLGYEYYNKLGYIPYDVKINENAARTLEYAYDDWCIYQLAKELKRPKKEINLFAERTHRMFGMVRDLLHTTNENDFNKLFSRVEKYENISDSMEVEIANYLNQVSEGRLSSESKLQIRSMLREVTEIESIGDSCYNLARTINRKHRSEMDFTQKQYDHIEQMFKLTDDALSQMIALVEDEHHTIDVNKSFNIEHEINNYRNQLKNQNVLDVNNKEYDYQMGVHYMDIITECEKLGDYVVNVVEAGSNVKEKKA